MSNRNNKNNTQTSTAENTPDNTPKNTPKKTDNKQKTPEPTEMYDIIKHKFDSKLRKDYNETTYIEGDIVEQFYHSFLADSRNNSLLVKKQFKRTLRKYILDNKLKVKTGKFDRSLFWTRILYYCA